MMKRLFDFWTALIGLIFLSPVFFVISVILKLASPGPVLHRGRRVGLNGKVFVMYKFRTMINEAEKTGPEITAEHDSRITGVGRILRRSKLDELPQLINVLKGDMSFVGPRPEDPRYVSCYTVEQQRVLSVRPGITSAASLAYRNEEQMLAGPDWEKVYRNEILPAKLAIEMDYLSHRDVFSDVRLIVRTIFSIFR